MGVEGDIIIDGRSCFINNVKVSGDVTVTYEVWEVRHQWQQFKDQTTVLMETLERWRETFAGIRELNLAGLLPNLKPVCLEIDQRMAQIEHMLNGKDPIRFPGQVALIVDKKLVHELNHFQKAEVAVAKAQIDHIEDINRSLFDGVQDIKGFSLPTRMPRRMAVGSFVPTLDPDRLAAAFQVVLTLWIAFLVWVYIDPPGHAMFVLFATLLALIAAMMHQSASIMFMPLTLNNLRGNTTS